jgi:predicted DNA-binding transcriptional regulator AlpA
MRDNIKTHYKIKTRDEQGSNQRRWIGVLELAAMLGCHPMSISRFAKTKPGFPQPIKPFGKNLWDAGEVEAYVAKAVAKRAGRAG